MNYIKESGIIYDCIYYGVVSFDDDNYKEICPAVTPDECLYPLFYSYIIDSPLVKYFKDNILNTNYYKNGIIDFIKLLNDRTKFKKFIFNYILSESCDDEFNCDEIDVTILSSSLRDLKYSESMIKSYTILFNNFDIYMDKLIEFLKNIYPVSKKMHKKHLKEIRLFLTKIERKRSVKKIADRFKVDSSLIENADAAVSVINKYSLNHIFDHSTGKMFLLMGYLTNKVYDVSFVSGDISILEDYKVNKTWSSSADL